MSLSPCARCGKGVPEHTKAGECPDGTGSFTWTLPPPRQLLNVLANLKAHGFDVDDLAAIVQERVDDDA